MADDPKDKPQINQPDDWLGLISYRMADTGRFAQGPYASLKRRMVSKLDVAARLAGDTIEWNFEKMSGMGIGDSVVQMLGLVIHQALLHMDRRRLLSAGLPQYQAPADLAAELATWHKLEHASQPVSKRFPKPADFGFPDGLSMEQYFKLILEKADKDNIDLSDPEDPKPNASPSGGKGKSRGKGQSSGDDEGDEQGDGESESDEEGEEEKEGGGKGDEQTPSQKLAKALGSKNQYHAQDHEGWKDVSPVQQEAMAAQLPDKIESWMKSRGIEPAGLKRLVDEIRNMKRERWYDKLRRLVGTKMACREYRHTIKRPSRRHGIPYPGRVRLRKGMLAVAIDTSGSIAVAELTIFISKLIGIAKAYDAPFEVIVCDAEIHGITKITRPNKIPTIDLKGGGGTSSLPVFSYLKDKHVDMLVYLTDLYIDFPQEPPNYKVIWGVVNRGGETNFEPAPFGETYHLDVEENPEAMRRRR